MARRKGAKHPDHAARDLSQEVSQYRATFVEQEHPRARDGRFKTKGAGDPFSEENLGDTMTETEDPYVDDVLGGQRESVMGGITTDEFTPIEWPGKRHRGSSVLGMISPYGHHRYLQDMGNEHSDYFRYNVNKSIKRATDEGWISFRYFGYDKPAYWWLRVGRLDERTIDKIYDWAQELPEEFRDGGRVSIDVGIKGQFQAAREVRLDDLSDRSIMSLYDNQVRYELCDDDHS